MGPVRLVAAFGELGCGRELGATQIESTKPPREPDPRPESILELVSVGGKKRCSGEHLVGVAVGRVVSCCWVVCARALGCCARCRVARVPRPGVPASGAGGREPWPRVRARVRFLESAPGCYPVPVCKRRCCVRCWGSCCGVFLLVSCTLPWWLVLLSKECRGDGPRLFNCRWRCVLDLEHLGFDRFLRFP